MYSLSLSYNSLPLSLRILSLFIPSSREGILPVTTLWTPLLLLSSLTSTRQIYLCGYNSQQEERRGADLQFERGWERGRERQNQERERTESEREKLLDSIRAKFMILVTRAPFSPSYSFFLPSLPLPSSRFGASCSNLVRELTKYSSLSFSLRTLCIITRETEATAVSIHTTSPLPLSSPSSSIHPSCLSFYVYLPLSHSMSISLSHFILSFIHSVNFDPKAGAYAIEARNVRTQSLIWMCA